MYVLVPVSLAPNCVNVCIFSLCTVSTAYFDVTKLAKANVLSPGISLNKYY
jgi:hypothetical protein